MADKTHKCEWCNCGVCEYYSTIEEQEENECFWDCNGTPEEMEECGVELEYVPGIFELMLNDHIGVKYD